MKKLLFILLLSPALGFSQYDCDSTQCVKYADMSSFEIVYNQNSSDSFNNNNLVLTCDLLCEIESRRNNHDVIFNYQGIDIIIYAEETVIITNEEGEKK